MGIGSYRPMRIQGQSSTPIDSKQCGHFGRTNRTQTVERFVASSDYERKLNNI